MLTAGEDLRKGLSSFITDFENPEGRKAAPALKTFIFYYRFCTGFFPGFYRFITALLPIVYRFVTGHFRLVLLLQGASQAFTGCGQPVQACAVYVHACAACVPGCAATVQACAMQMQRNAALWRGRKRLKSALGAAFTDVGRLSRV